VEAALTSPPLASEHPVAQPARQTALPASAGDTLRQARLAEAMLQAQLAEARGNVDRAVAWYRRALQLDPAHTPAIANLGRLAFRPPAHPFMDGVARRHPVDIRVVTVEVRNPCNYRCFYCVAAGQNNEPVKRFDLAAVERSLAQVEAELVITELECGGGEPTVHPQFPDLIRILAARGAVSFPSNNSQDPARWLPREHARRLYMRAAVHPETETKTGLETYARNARHLIDAGVSFSSMFIAHPTRLPRLPELRAFFAERDVPFQPIGFIGVHEGKSYPHAYTDEEKRLIGLTDDGDANWLVKIQPRLNRTRQFRGIPCNAGYRNLYLSRDGSFRRCTYDRRKIPAPLPGPTPCEVKSCGCGMMLAAMKQQHSVDQYNFFGPMAGLEAHDIEWAEKFARDLGYASLTDAMVQEQTTLFDAIMQAYGKDDFPEDAPRQ
jgi:MoaA/NifB/PqqE/SkfB family radical SAM enzyme